MVPTLDMAEPLIERMAHQYRSKLTNNVDVEDLKQEARIAVLFALPRFDPDKGDFNTFVGSRIRGAMIDHVRSLDWLSRTDRDAQKRIDKVRHNLTQYLGRSPSQGEMAKEMDMPLRTYQDLEQMLHDAQPGYLEELQDEDDIGFLERHAGPEEDPCSLLIKKQQLEALDRAARRLSPRHATIFERYFAGDLLTEIGAIVGVSDSAIRQNLNTIIDRLIAAVRDTSEGLHYTNLTPNR